MNDTQALPASDGDRQETDNGVTDRDADRANHICPMCPGDESDQPAAYPKCGMALEPATVSAGNRL